MLPQFWAQYCSWAEITAMHQNHDFINRAARKLYSVRDDRLRIAIAEASIGKWETSTLSVTV